MEQEIDAKNREPLDDEERELMNPETWDWESVTELPPATNPGVVLPIRLTLEEMTRVGRAADAEGVSIYEYIKQSVISRVLDEAIN
jgi:hypothetical protein